MNIGDKIKEQRLRKELTQEQLSELLNVSRSTVSSWEVGRNYPDLETIVAISDLFGISLDKLLREDTTMAKDLSKKMRWNKYYKIILIAIGILVLIYAGMNFKLRSDERRYLHNLSAKSWKIDENDNYGGHILKENGVRYSTYIMEVGLLAVPVNELKPWVIARKGKLVVEVENTGKLYAVIAKDNDKNVKHNGGKVAVDINGKLLESNSKWSQAKKEFIVAYLKEHHTEYVSLLKNAAAKRQEIIAGN